MIERYLVVTTVHNGTYTDDEVQTFVRESDVRDLVGKIAAGNYSAFENEVELNRIFKVDLIHGKITELEPTLVNMKIVLSEKK